MATKKYHLPLKCNQDIVFGGTSNDQYSNLQLNRADLQYSTNAFSETSKTVSPEKGKFLSFDFEKIDNSPSGKNSHSWNKSTKDLPLKNGFGKDDGKGKPLNIINGSTLSLHIEAYENSIKTEACDSFSAETKKEDWMKKLENHSTSIIQNPFEFPRQQKSNKAKMPELAPYKASQCLFNSSQMNQVNYQQQLTQRSAKPMGPVTVTSSSSKNDKNDEYQQLFLNMMERFRDRMSSSFNDLFGTLAKYDGIEHEKSTSDFLDLVFRQTDNKYHVFVQFTPFSSPIKVWRPYRYTAIYNKLNYDEKTLVQLLTNYENMNCVCITISEATKSLVKFSDDLLKIVLTSKSRRSPIQAPMTLLNGYIPRSLFNTLSPYIQSSFLMFTCTHGSEKYGYQEIVKTVKHQNAIHFGKEVVQKFSKNKHFRKLRETILSNPSIECFSFTCNLDKFDFIKFFTFLSDPTFKIKGHKINLSFTFYSYCYIYVADLVDPQMLTLFQLLEERTEFSDCIRVKFNTIGVRYGQKGYSIRRIR